MRETPPAASTTFAAARERLARALGPEFVPSDLRLLSGSTQRKDYLATACGGALGADAASRLLQRLRRRSGLRGDLYAARSQFYR